MIAKNIGLSVDNNTKHTIPNALSDSASNKLPKKDCTFNFLAKNPSIKSVKKNPIAAKPVASAPQLANIGIIAIVPNERIAVIKLTNIWFLLWFLPYFSALVFSFSIFIV